MASKHNLVPSGKNPQGDLTLIQIAQRFSTEEAARDYFEKLRWPDGPVCAHCGNADQERVYKVTPNPAKKIRAGLYKCAECLQSFTVTVGTVCEDSHIPLNKWLIGFYMMCASKTQVSALQLQRQLEIGSYRSEGCCARTFIRSFRHEKWRYSYGAQITPRRIAWLPMPSGEAVISLVRAHLASASRIESLAFEEVADELDRDIARERLSERLVSGKELDARLAKIES